LRTASIVSREFAFAVASSAWSCRKPDSLHLPHHGRFGITATEVTYRWKGDGSAQPDAKAAHLRELKAHSLKKVGQASRLPELSFEDAIDVAPLKIPTGTGFSFRFRKRRQ